MKNSSGVAGKLFPNFRRHLVGRTLRNEIRFAGKLVITQNGSCVVAIYTVTSLFASIVLCQLHWLPVQRRVELKIECLAHQSIIVVKTSNRNKTTLKT